GIGQRARSDDEKTDYSPEDNRGFAHDSQRHADGGRVTERAQNYSIAGFVNSDGTGDKAEGEVNYFGERFDNVSGGDLRDKPQQPESDINFDYAGYMRGQVQANHGEESRTPSLVETINRQFYPVNMMAPRAQKLWPKALPCEAVDDASEQRDTTTCRRGRGDYSEKRARGNYDQDVPREGWDGIGKKHQASAPED